MSHIDRLRKHASVYILLVRVQKTPGLVALACDPSGGIKVLEVAVTMGWVREHGHLGCQV